MHWTSLQALSTHATLHDLRELVRRCQVELGEYDIRTFDVRLRLLHELLNEDRYHLAREECHDFLDKAHMVQPLKFMSYCRAEGLYYLARCQKWFLERELAVTTLREAIDVRLV